MHEVLQVKDSYLLCQKLLEDPSRKLQSNHDYHGIFSKIQSTLEERIVWSYLFDTRKDVHLIFHQRRDLTVSKSTSRTI